MKLVSSGVPDWNLVSDEKVNTAMSIFVSSLVCDVPNNFRHMLCSLCWHWTRRSFVCSLMRSVLLGADSVLTVEFSSWCFVPSAFVLCAGNRFLQYTKCGCLEPFFLFIYFNVNFSPLEKSLWFELRWYWSTMGRWVYRQGCLASRMQEGDKSVGYIKFKSGNRCSIFLW